MAKGLFQSFAGLGDFATPDQYIGPIGQGHSQVLPISSLRWELCCQLCEQIKALALVFRRLAVVEANAS
jgi:hypothetical protein